ncbi:MAG: hypothetical protein Q9182_004807 [Xanthomendoza sp. 2 TL-2023]
MHCSKLLVAIAALLRLSSAAHNDSHTAVERAALKDNEPGDTLNRTICFCTTDNTLEQADNDPAVFYNVSINHQMAYVYQIGYYNHRLDKHMLISANKTCHTRPNYKDPYWHNDCLAWENQHKDMCADFQFDNLPEGVDPKHHDWQFCYLWRGDRGTDEKKRDFFKFDGQKRGLPSQRDWVVPVDEVTDKCTTLCQETHEMDLFESKLGGWFHRMDGFNVLGFEYYSADDCERSRCM